MDEENMHEPPGPGPGGNEGAGSPPVIGGPGGNGVASSPPVIGGSRGVAPRGNTAPPG